MNARFFALAFAAAINPTLLGVDLILIVSRRPRSMLTFLLFGGLGMAITIGLVDVLILRSNPVKTQGGLGPGVDLGIGLILLIAAGVLVAVGRRQVSPEMAAAKTSVGSAGSTTEDGWMQRTLREPKPSVAVLVGAVLGLPGGLYLAALHGLATGNYSTATRVVAVILFAVIEFTLLIVPLILLTTRPEAATDVLHRMNKWLVVHGRKLGLAVSLVLGTYLTISGIVGLLS